MNKKWFVIFSLVLGLPASAELGCHYIIARYLKNPPNYRVLSSSERWKALWTTLAIQPSDSYLTLAQRQADELLRAKTTGHFLVSDVAAFADEVASAGLSLVEKGQNPDTIRDIEASYPKTGAAIGELFLMGSQDWHKLIGFFKTFEIEMETESLKDPGHSFLYRAIQVMAADGSPIRSQAQKILNAMLSEELDDLEVQSLFTGMRRLSEAAQRFPGFDYQRLPVSRLPWVRVTGGSSIQLLKLTQSPNVNRARISLRPH